MKPVLLRLGIYSGLALAVLGILWSVAPSATSLAGRGTGQAWHEIPDSAPDAGQAAPGFSLKNIDGSGNVSLGDFAGKPVVLVFGSYTWPPFRKGAGRLNELHSEYRGSVEFVFIYIREAHPVEGSHMQVNVNAGIVVNEPRTIEQRSELAEICRQGLGFGMVTLVDDMDNSTGSAYEAHPDRLYLVDAHGRIAWRSGRGPFGVNPDELGQQLELIAAAQ